MALIKCPECGKEISDKSGKCLYCGCPIVRPENIDIPEKEMMTIKVAADGYLFPVVAIILFVTMFLTNGINKSNFTMLTLLIICIICFLRILSIHSIKLKLTTKGIYGQKGFIFTTKFFTPLSAISSLTVEAGLFGKSAKYGDIKIVSADGSYSFATMKRAEEFNRKFMELRGTLDWRTF